MWKLPGDRSVIQFFIRGLEDSQTVALETPWDKRKYYELQRSPIFECSRVAYFLTF